MCDFGNCVYFLVENVIKYIFVLSGDICLYIFICFVVFWCVWVKIDSLFVILKYIIKNWLFGVFFF